MLIMRDKNGNTIVEVFDNRYDKQVDYVATHLREADFDEVFAVTGQSPHLGVIESWNMSSRRWMIFNKRALPVAVLGVRPDGDLFSNTGIPWLLGAEGLNKMKKFFLRICKPTIREMLIGFDILVNYVDARYLKAVRWLEWCGFEIEEPLPYGASGLPFHRFSMRSI